MARRTGQDHSIFRDRLGIQDQGPNERRLLVSDVARVLNVSTDRVRDLERSGQLRAIRTPGGTRLFDAEEVARLALDRAVRKGRCG